MYTEQELTDIVIELKHKAYALRDLIEDMQARNAADNRNMTEGEDMYLVNKLYALVLEILSYKNALPSDHNLINKCEELKQECEEIFEEVRISKQEIEVHQDWVNNKI